MDNAGRLSVRQTFSYLVSTLSGKIHHYMKTLKPTFLSNPGIPFLEIYIKEIIRDRIKDWLINV